MPTVRSPLAWSLAALVLASGCLGSSSDGGTGPAAGARPPIEELLSKVRFTALPGESLFYEASDGTQLHARVFRPDTASEPAWKLPIILEMSPYYPSYGRDDPTDAAEKPGGRQGWLIDHFVPRGYAVVLADVPGTGESGGCLEQTGPKQMAAGYDTVELFATQSWASGKVGTFGISYPGETQISVAGLVPPHLTTIVPAAAVSDQYNYSYYGGVPYELQGIGTMAGYYATGGAIPGTQPEGLDDYAERHPCHVENLAAGADASGDYTQYWRDRDYKPNAHTINASVLYVHGLQDWNVKPNAIANMYDRIVAPKKGLFGQWQHNWPDGNSFNRDWSRDDWQTTLHQWYDQWLLGIDNGAMDGDAVQVQDELGRWRYEKDWPPSDAIKTDLYLDFAEHGRATFNLSEVQTGTLEWFDDSAESPATGMLPAGPLRPANHIAYMTEPLAAEFHYAGEPVVELHLASDKPSTHVAVALLDIDAEGNERITNRGYLSTPHRDSVYEPTDAPVGDVMVLRFPMFPQDDVFEAGHRIRLVVSSDDDWTASDDTRATNTLHHGGLTLSKVTFPVVERDLTVVGFQPPYKKVET